MGKRAKRDSGVFRYDILPVGKERKKLGKAKMKGREGEKTRCKNRMRRREIYRTGIGKRGRLSYARQE